MFNRIFLFVLLGFLLLSVGVFTAEGNNTAFAAAPDGENVNAGIDSSLLQEEDEEGRLPFKRHARGTESRRAQDGQAPRGQDLLSD